MKWLSIILSATSALSGPTSPAFIVGAEERLPAGSQTVIAQTSDGKTFIETLFADDASQTLLEEDAAAHAQLVENTNQMNATLKRLRGTVGRTWYAFSGTTPAGWDCSGLVLWTYEQLGITLEHRADKQAREGKVVKNPKPGDIMVFSTDGGRTFYHSAIYLGDGKLVQALRPKTSTRIDPVDSALFKGNTIRYIRIIDTLE